MQIDGQAYRIVPDMNLGETVSEITLVLIRLVEGLHMVQFGTSVVTEDLYACICVASFIITADFSPRSSAGENLSNCQERIL